MDCRAQPAAVDAPRARRRRNLNILLQHALAPYRDGTAERRHGARVFRVGDKVIQIRNNYDKGATHRLAVDRRDATSSSMTRSWLRAAGEVM